MRLIFLISVLIASSFSFGFWLSAENSKINKADQANITNKHNTIVYDYEKLQFDIPVDILTTEKTSFELWQKKIKSHYIDIVRESWPWTPKLERIYLLEDNSKFKKLKIEINYNKDCPMSNSPSGGILAIPKTTDASKPILIAIHGHERSTWGQYPLDMFDEGQWARVLVDNGFIVFCPVSMHHAKIKEYGDKYGYLVVWTKIMSDYIDSMKNEWKKHPHNGFAVAGLSAGGQISYSLMAYRDDIKKGFFAGASQPLDFMRREYRVKGHPECWDIPAIASYTVILGLLPPNSVRFYLGRKDPFYPNMERFPVYPWFDGTKRDVTTDEFYGQFLLLKEFFKIRGGDLDLIIHNGGHEIDGQIAADFFSAR